MKLLTKTIPLTNEFLTHPYQHGDKSEIRILQIQTQSQN